MTLLTLDLQRIVIIDVVAVWRGGGGAEKERWGWVSEKREMGAGE